MIKMRDPENNNDWVPIAGEWHLMAHLLEGIDCKNWWQIYEPIMLRFDIKGLQYKCVDEANFLKTSLDDGDCERTLQVVA